MKIKTEIRRRREIPEKKKQELAYLVELLKKMNTTMIVSIENLSSLQFQQIKHSLKNKAIVKIVKKKILMKALDEVKKTKGEIRELEKWLKGNFAILFSDEDPFEIAVLLSEKKFPAKVKAGQVAPGDIILEAGPTDLPAGPVISELAKAKIKAGIEGGKIAIKESCVLVKKGEKISEDAANILMKLEITPFNVAFEPLAAYSNKENKVYENIKIDKTRLITELRQAKINAINLALKVSYPTEETIKMLLFKATLESNAMLNLIKE